jgi:DNA replication protein DnaC
MDIFDIDGGIDDGVQLLKTALAAVSLLDRLLHHASVVVTDGDSYRMREARAKKGTTLNKT